MIEFRVEAMSCGHCVSMVTKAVMSVDPAARVDVDLAAKAVRVETVEAGYPPVGADSTR